MATHLRLVEDADKETLATIDRLIRQIGPILASNPPAVQGVVLADLLASWIEGHVIVGKKAETDQMRAELLSTQIRTVTAMVPLGIWSLGIEQQPF
jgi:hypothetical protein